MSVEVILISGASSGIGALTVRALALSGHTVYAGMRDISGRNADAASQLLAWSEDSGAVAVPIELDVLSEASIEAATARVMAEQGRLDILIHNAGHMVLGPAEAFSPAQLAELYDVNVLGSHRLNRAVLPHLRAQGEGLVIWVSSASVRGATPPYMAPYFAAKAAMESLAMSMSLEIGLFGIETAIVVPGAFVAGTSHFTNAGGPVDLKVATEYDAEFPQLGRLVSGKLAALTPPDADVADVATTIAAIVDAPAGERPFRVHIDPIDGGSERVGELVDRFRKEYYARIELTELLDPITRRSSRRSATRG